MLHKIFIDLQWSPSNPDRLGPVHVAGLSRCPLFRGYCYNVGVVERYFQWRNVTCDSKIKHIKATSGAERWYLAALALFLAFSSSCCSFNQWTYKFVGKVSAITWVGRWFGLGGGRIGTDLEFWRRWPHPFLLCLRFFGGSQPPRPPLLRLWSIKPSWRWNLAIKNASSCGTWTAGTLAKWFVWKSAN